MARFAFTLILAAVLASAVAGEARTHSAGPARGRALAIEACSSCHKVTARQAQPTPVLDPDTRESVIAPSFYAVAAKFGRDTAAMRAFILAPAHPMREQQFVPRDLNDIVAYIHGLSLSKRRF
jgi:mono/diheme cytochrome c family protein